MAAPNPRLASVALDFTGLDTNGGPFAEADRPGAAEDQVNLTCVKPGQLQARPGLAPVLFDEEPLL
jgi:hypothetical protein